jgi:hypothetical protein
MEKILHIAALAIEPRRDAIINKEINYSINIFHRRPAVRGKTVLPGCLFLLSKDVSIISV